MQIGDGGSRSTKGEGRVKPPTPRQSEHWCRWTHSDTHSVVQYFKILTNVHIMKNHACGMFGGCGTLKIPHFCIG